jgi:hypothetical protein
MNLQVDDIYTNVICESFKDKETGRLRVRPIDIKVPDYTIVVECSKKEREAHPIGTKFTAKEVKVCKKPNGRFYLRAKDQMIYKL